MKCINKNRQAKRYTDPLCILSWYTMQTTICGPNDEWLIVADDGCQAELWVEQDFLIATDTWERRKEMR